MKDFLKFLASSLVGLCCASTVHANSSPGVPYRLTPAFGDNQEVSYSQVSPDGTTVVYIADQDEANTYELYSVSVQEGSQTTKINGVLAPNAHVRSFRIAPDNSAVIYAADEEAFGDIELYRVPLTGGSRTKLFERTDEISDYHITPDSSQVIFTTPNPAKALNTIPITGGAIDTLTPTLAGGEINEVLIDGNSARIVYRAQQDTAGVYELYSVPANGSAMPTKLNAPLASGDRDVSADFKLTNDGTRVVYRANNRGLNDRDLYSVPIAGGTETKINAAGVASSTVLSFAISPDSQKVAYLSDQFILFTYELFETSIDTDTATRLNPNLPANGDVYAGFVYSPDSKHLVYSADQRVNGDNELFAVDLVTLKNSLLWDPRPRASGDPIELKAIDIDEGSYLATDFSVVNLSSSHVIFKAGGCMRISTLRGRLVQVRNSPSLLADVCLYGKPHSVSLAENGNFAFTGLRSVFEFVVSKEKVARLAGVAHHRDTKQISYASNDNHIVFVSKRETFRFFRDRYVLNGMGRPHLYAVHNLSSLLDDFCTGIPLKRKRMVIVCQ